MAERQKGCDLAKMVHSGMEGQERWGRRVDCWS